MRTSTLLNVHLQILHIEVLVPVLVLVLVLVLQSVFEFRWGCALESAVLKVVQDWLDSRQDFLHLLEHLL